MKRCLCGLFAISLTISMFCSCFPNSKSSIGLDSQSNSSIDDQITYKFGENEMLQPFWTGNIMWNESVALREDENGVISGKLLFEPTRIISVRNYALNTTYTMGLDFTICGKEITMVEGRNMPYFTARNLLGLDTNDETIGGPTMIDKNGNTFLFSEGPYIHKRQISISYECDKSDFEDIDTPKKQIESLPKTAKKINNQEAIKILLYGDSIGTGAACSSSFNEDPQMENYFNLFTSRLHTLTNCRITSVNKSKGGVTSDWGVENMNENIGLTAADLIILAFGMNDASGSLGVPSVPNERFINNYRKMINKAVEVNENCEIIIMNPMLSNSIWSYSGDNMRYNTELISLCKEVNECGVKCVYIDINTMHKAILERKSFIDISGNNVNHPNDFFSRILAQSLLVTLGECKVEK